MLLLDEFSIVDGDDNDDDVLGDGSEFLLEARNSVVLSVNATDLIVLVGPGTERAQGDDNKGGDQLWQWRKLDASTCSITKRKITHRNHLDLLLLE